MLRLVVASALLASSCAVPHGEHAAQQPESACDVEQSVDEVALLQHAQVKSHMRSDDVSSRDGRPSDFGPLDGLIGTWVTKPGTFGKCVVEVPNYYPGDKESVMRTMVNYTERITFRPILGTVKNRGFVDADQINPTANLIQELIGVSYHTEIYNNGTSYENLFNGLLHVEDGQWLWNQKPGVDTTWTVARMSLIPHGVGLGALGEHTTMPAETLKQNLTDMLNGPSPWSKQPANTKGKRLLGRKYFSCEGPTKCEPLWYLANDIGQLTSDSVDILAVRSGAKGGGLFSLPDPLAQVSISGFNSTFFLEKIWVARNTSRHQLQYIQNSRFRFNSNLGDGVGCRDPEPPAECRIEWNHVQSNTLVRL